MRYELPEIPFITPQSMRLRYGPSFDPNVFTRWQRDGLVEKVRNGLYRRTDWKMRGEWDRWIIAQHLYAPSYISLHSAFRYYNFIPETVVEVSSITTKRTRQFVHQHVGFTYRSVRPELFFGYSYLNWNNSVCALAGPEKALLDFAYLLPRYFEEDELLELRLDVDEMEAHIDPAVLATYLDLFDSTVLRKRVTLLLNVYEMPRI